MSACVVTDLLLPGDGGLPLLQHGEELRDLQLEGLLRCGRRPLGGDLRLEPRNLNLERGRSTKTG